MPLSPAPAPQLVLCEPLLNPGWERQAIGRSLRMGQTREVTVTKLLAKGENND